jgi:hypothetical protein
MTQLRLTLSRARGEDEGGYLPLQTDETVASWARRQSGVHLQSDSRDEDTFGQLAIDLPKLPRTLRQQLQRAAQPPDAWLLRPYQRTLQCPRCIAEDWAQGVPAHHRRAWCVAWRTCCPRHGPMFDLDTVSRKTPPTWECLLDGPRWIGQDLSIVHTRPHWVLLNLSLGSDRRAVHLEAALAGRRRGAWFPKGMTQTTLRETYQEIVSDLLAQVELAHDGPEDQLPHPGFNREQNGNRFAINVLTEAILSEWTNTPLPTSVLAQRTTLLVRVIGWGEGRPSFVRAGQVLFRGPIERMRPLVRYATLLRPKDYAQLARPMEASHVGYLTLPEARLLGVPCRETVTRIAQMTAQGQFLAFDARRGCLVENPFLPIQARLAPEQAPREVILPEWAFRPPLAHAQVAVSDELRQLFGPKSPDMELRWAARQRRWRREERKGVRFRPSTRPSDAQPSSEECRQELPD